MAHQKTPQIFLCHANEDIASVKDIYELLSKQGFRPWLDKEDLLPGQIWGEEIPKALRRSDYVLIFFSKTSVHKRGYVQKEFKLSLEVLEEIPEDQIFIIPLRLDECEVPDRFRHIHYVDLFEDGAYQKVLDAIGSSQSGSSPKQTPERSKAKAEQSIEKDWLDLLEEGNAIKLKRHLTGLNKQIENSVEIQEIHKKESTSPSNDSLKESIDLISLQLLTLVEYDIEENLTVLVDLLAHAYNSLLGPDPAFSVEYPEKVQVELWTAIITRLYLVGAFALKLKRYDFVRPLICITPQGGTDFYWVRHALILHARAREDQNKVDGMVALANSIIPETPWIADKFEVGSREAIQYLASFDLYQCIIAAHDAQDVSACYPSFGQFGNYHLHDTLLDIALNRGGRVILGEMADSEISSLLVRLDDYARKEYAFYAGWRPRAFPEEVRDFIEQNQE